MNRPLPRICFNCRNYALLSDGRAMRCQRFGYIIEPHTACPEFECHWPGEELLQAVAENFDLPEPGEQRIAAE